jgi:hypothetical protein
MKRQTAKSGRPKSLPAVLWLFHSSFDAGRSKFDVLLRIKAAARVNAGSRFSSV